MSKKQSKRKSYSPEQRLKIARDALQTSAADAAARWGVSKAAIYSYIKELKNGEPYTEPELRTYEDALDLILDALDKGALSSAAAADAIRKLMQK